MAEKDGKNKGPVRGNGSRGGKGGVRDKEQIDSEDKSEGDALIRENALGIQRGDTIWASMITNHFVNCLSFGCVEANSMGMPMVDVASFGISFFIKVFDSSLDESTSENEKKKILHDVIEKYFLAVKPVIGNA